MYVKLASRKKMLAVGAATRYFVLFYKIEMALADNMLWVLPGVLVGLLAGTTDTSYTARQ